LISMPKKKEHRNFSSLRNPIARKKKNKKAFGKGTRKDSIGIYGKRRVQVAILEGRSDHGRLRRRIEINGKKRNIKIDKLVTDHHWGGSYSMGGEKKQWVPRLSPYWKSLARRLRAAKGFSQKRGLNPEVRRGEG